MRLSARPRDHGPSSRRRRHHHCSRLLRAIFLLVQDRAFEHRFVRREELREGEVDGRRQGELQQKFNSGD
jgi:hypothetical protein